MVVVGGQCRLALALPAGALQLQERPTAPGWPSRPPPPAPPPVHARVPAPAGSARGGGDRASRPGSCRRSGGEAARARCGTRTPWPARGGRSSAAAAVRREARAATGGLPSHPLASSARAAASGASAQERRAQEAVEVEPGGRDRHSVDAPAADRQARAPRIPVLDHQQRASRSPRCVRAASTSSGSKNGFGSRRSGEVSPAIQIRVRQRVQRDVAAGQFPRRAPDHSVFRLPMPGHRGYGGIGRYGGDPAAHACRLSGRWPSGLEQRRARPLTTISHRPGAAPWSRAGAGSHRSRRP